VRLQNCQARVRELSTQVTTLQEAFAEESRISKLMAELAQEREGSVESGVDGGVSPTTAGIEAEKLHTLDRPRSPASTGQATVTMRPQDLPRSPSRSGTPSGPTLLGASVHHLRTAFLDEVHSAGHDWTATLRDVRIVVVQMLGATARSSRDGRMGAAYVDLLQGEDSVGQATHILSCSWETSVREVAEALDHHCCSLNLPPERTYIWMSCLCVNQFTPRCVRSGCAACTIGEPITPVEPPTEDYNMLIRAIGKLLVLLCPWESPYYLTEVRCVGELFIALSLGPSSCELAAVTPPGEAARLRASLLDGGGNDVSAAWKAFASVQIECCEPYEPSAVGGDEQMLGYMTRAGASYSLVNFKVASFLHMWLATAAEGHVRQLLASARLHGEAAARACDLVGWLLREVCLHHRAAAMLQDGLQLSLKTGGADVEAPSKPSLFLCLGSMASRQCGTPSEALEAAESKKTAMEHSGTLKSTAGVALLSSLAMSRWSSGDQSGTLEALLEAKDICNETKTLESPDGAALLRNIGIVKWYRADCDGGLEDYMQAKLICQRTGTFSSLSSIGLLLTIGFAKADRGDADGMLKAFEETRRLYDCHGTLETPSAATLLATMGVARGNCGDHVAALEAYGQARQIRERTQTMCSPAGAVLARNIGIAMAAVGRRPAALEAYREAQRLREQAGFLATAAGAGLLTSLGLALSEGGDRQAAVEVCREAKHIFEFSRTLHTSTAQALLGRLSDLELDA